MPTVAAEIARALAGAFLSGPWEPDSMAHRGQRVLATRRGFVARLAHTACSAFREPPADGPRELACFLAACDDLVHEAYRWEDAEEDLGWSFPPPRRLAVPTVMGHPRWSVPVLHDRAALGRWLGLTPGELAWLSDPRSLEARVADERLRHYHRRWAPTASGSVRLLEAPKRRTKALQREVLHGIVDRIAVHPAAHGFRAGRSVLTAARHHVGQEVVIRVDLQSFFTSITAARVYGVFRTAGYPEPVAHALAGLCTTVTPPFVLRQAPPVAERHRGRHQALLQRLRAPHLPQGAPTSPALSNLVAFGLDARLSGLAGAFDATYTRYADDLVISGPRRLVRRSDVLLAAVDTITSEEGFRINTDKTAVMTRSGRQHVCGLVVNDRLNVARHEVDRLRAVLHDAAVNGPDAANRDAHPDFRSHLLGRIAWVCAANPDRAPRLTAAFEAVHWD